MPPFFSSTPPRVDFSADGSERGEIDLSGACLVKIASGNDVERRFYQREKPCEIEPSADNRVDIDGISGVAPLLYVERLQHERDLLRADLGNPYILAHLFRKKNGRSEQKNGHCEKDCP